MIIDCCAQQRSYEKFFGLLAQVECIDIDQLLIIILIGFVFIYSAVIKLCNDNDLLHRLWSLHNTIVVVSQKV